MLEQLIVCVAGSPFSSSPSFSFFPFLFSIFTMTGILRLPLQLFSFLLCLLAMASLCSSSESPVIAPPESDLPVAMSSSASLFKLLREFSYVMDLAVAKDVAELARIKPEFERLLKLHVEETAVEGRNQSIVHEVIRSVYHAQDHITKDVMASGRASRVFFFFFFFIFIFDFSFSFLFFLSFSFIFFSTSSSRSSL